MNADDLADRQRRQRIAYRDGVSIDHVPTSAQLAAQRTREADADRAAIARYVAARAAAEAEQAAAQAEQAAAAAEQERQQRVAAYDDSLGARISAALRSPAAD